MDLTNILIFGAIAAIFIIPTTIQARRQRRRMEEIQSLQNSLHAGDRVVTTSGVHGVVRGMSEELVDLEIAVGVTMTWERSAIIRKVDTSSVSTAADGMNSNERFWEDTDVRTDSNDRNEDDEIVRSEAIEHPDDGTRGERN
ncbi:preprotein translocase subunit YajC [Corynebacterium sp. CCM 9204]|uniref:preprotein translocase subunit YajC n=1 Tax=Corynebacterium sp. CCM 9204 TaxID=3057616 RepID=UPI00352688C9